MKVRIERDVFAEAVTWVARALPARPPVPVLTGILMTTLDDATIRLSGFDYEVSRTIDISATVTAPGQVLVSGKLLAEISRSLPSHPVELVAEDTKVQVRCGDSKFGLLVMPLEDYPALPPFPEAAGTVAGDEFAQAVAQVSVAAGKDDRVAAAVPLLTGILMELSGETLTLLATDRYRLAVRSLPWRPANPEVDTKALIPARTLSDMSKALGAVGDVTLALGSGTTELVGCQAGGRTTTSMVLDGEYPAVRSLFPDESPIQCVVETHVLTEAVRRVAVVAERENKVHLTFTDEAITLEAGVGEDAQASEIIDARLTGDSLTVTFNPQYLLDGLAGLQTPYTRLSFTNATKAAVISGQAEDTGDDDDSFRYLIMPMRQ